MSDSTSTKPSSSSRSKVQNDEYKERKTYDQTEQVDTDTHIPEIIVTKKTYVGRETPDPIVFRVNVKSIEQRESTYRLNRKK